MQKLPGLTAKLRSLDAEWARILIEPWRPYPLQKNPRIAQRIATVCPPYQFDFIDCFSNVATVAKPLAVTPYYTSTPFHYG
jgi:hypothetical protein